MAEYQFQKYNSSYKRQSDTKINWFYLQKKSLSWNPYLCITKVTVVGLLKKKLQWIHETLSPSHYSPFQC